MPLSGSNPTEPELLLSWRAQLDAFQPPAPGILPVAIRNVVSLCRIVFDEERQALIEYSSYLSEREQRAQTQTNAVAGKNETDNERKALCCWLAAALKRRVEAVRFLRNAYWEVRQIRGLHGEDEQTHIRLKKFLSELDIQLRGQYLVWLNELINLAQHEGIVFSVEIIPTIHSLNWEE